MIARRSVRGPEEISYRIAYDPADTTLDQLIYRAGSRGHTPPAPTRPPGKAPLQH